MDSALLGDDMFESVGRNSELIPIAYLATADCVRGDMDSTDEIGSLKAETDLHIFMKNAARLLGLFGVPLSIYSDIPFSREDVQRISAIVENIEQKVLEGRVSGPADALVRSGNVLLMASRTELYRAVKSGLDYPSRALRIFEAALVVDPQNTNALEGN